MQSVSFDLFEFCVDLFGCFIDPRAIILVSNLALLGLELDLLLDELFDPMLVQCSCLPLFNDVLIDLGLDLDLELVQL